MNEITETTKRQGVPITLEQMLVQADLFVKSGFFPKAIDTKEKAVVVMMKGRELGLPFTEALSKINIIAGIAVTKVETLLGLAQSKGLIEDLKITDSPTFCEVTIKRKGQSPFTCRFGDDDAKRITTSEWRDGKKYTIPLIEKDNYKKQKNVMYRWRALAMNLRLTCPDAIGGLYIDEEIAHEVVINAAGEVTEIIEAGAPPAAEQQAAQVEGPDDLSAADIPEDQIVGFVMPIGKYTGRTLLEIATDETPTGAKKGMDYLRWAVENITSPAQGKTVAAVKRFLELHGAELSREPGSEG